MSSARWLKDVNEYSSGGFIGQEGDAAVLTQRNDLWPPYSCIFRVELEAEPQEGSNGASPVATHACAGL